MPVYFTYRFPAGPVPTGHGSSYAGDEAHAESAQELAVPLLEAEAEKGDRRASWPVTVVTLLSLQLGWGLWLLPADYARWAVVFTCAARLHSDQLSCLWVCQQGLSRQRVGPGWGGCLPPGPSRS